MKKTHRWQEVGWIGVHVLDPDQSEVHLVQVPLAMVESAPQAAPEGTAVAATEAAEAADATEATEATEAAEAADARLLVV